MNDYVIGCGSTVDLTPEHLKKINVEYVKYHFMLDGKEYFDDLGQTMTHKDFYNALRNGANPSTSQVNSSEFLEFFTPFLEQGKDIIQLCFSSGLSGSYQAAKNAAAIAAERYPERKIYVVDTLCASSGHGLFVDKAAELRDSGMSIDELRDWATQNALRMHHWFFSTDLTFYIKGGRVSKVAGTIGGILGICPLLNVDYHGHLIPRAKIPGKRRVTNEMLKRMEQFADNGYDYDEKCYISNSDCPEDAKVLADMVRAKFPKVREVLINDIGTTIGSHSGPGTVALFFWGKKRED